MPAAIMYHLPIIIQPPYLQRRRSIKERQNRVSAQIFHLKACVVSQVVKIIGLLYLLEYLDNVELIHSAWTSPFVIL